MHPNQIFSSEAGYTLHPARVEVALPGLLPQQEALYEKDVRGVITRLAGCLDLTKLAGVSFHPQLSDGLKSIDQDIGDLPSSAVCAVVSVPTVDHVDQTFIVADLHCFLSLLDPDHPDYLSCLQSFGHALGLVHAASELSKAFCERVHPGLDPIWTRLSTDCCREYLASSYTYSIGTDPLDSRCRRLERTFEAAIAGGAEIAEMVDTGYYFDHMPRALFESYREFFLAASSLLGCLSAKGQTITMFDSSPLKVPESVLVWMELYRIRLLILRQAIALGSHVEAAIYNFGLELQASLYKLEVARNPEAAEDAMVLGTNNSEHRSSVYDCSFPPKG